jgi:general stress protein 26
MMVEIRLAQVSLFPETLFKFFMEHNEQNHAKNLSDKKAVNKLKELISSAKICMFETVLPSPPFNLRPMSPVETDNEGNIWFFSDKTSNKNKEITANPHVQLSFSNMNSSEFLSVYGKAEIIMDKKKFEELWSPIVKVWFKEGKDDPNLSLIKITPRHSYYWDTKHNRMVALLKMAAALASGKTLDDGVEGRLNI